MSYRGVIFDFNGVLVFDSPLHERAWRDVAERLRGRAMTPGELSEQVHGRTNRHVFEYLLGRPIDGEELAELVDLKETSYRALCRQDPDFGLSPGAADLFDHLRRLGVASTIATSSEAVNLDFFFATLGLGRWFSRERVVYDDGSLRGKPEPDMYLAAARRLALDPAECVVVEDALSGIEAARRAGVGRIYALGPRERHPALCAVAGVGGVLATLTDFPRQVLRRDALSVERVAVKPVGEARVTIEERAPRPCGENEVLAKILHAGICSTDLQIYRGERRLEPGVLGHECVAEVVARGERVQGVEVGETIALNPNNPLDEHDKIGHGREGVFQEIFAFHRNLVTHGQVVKLPPSPRPEWVLLEVLACVLHAQGAMGEAFAGREVLVVGAGVTGLLHVLAARLSGARRVLLANRSAPRLDLAVRTGLIGAEDAILGDAGLAAEVLARTGGRGAGAIILALAGDGGAAAAERALSVAADGATLCLFGGFLPGARIRAGAGAPVDCSRVRSERLRVDVEARPGRRATLVGSRGSLAADYERARDLAVAGRIDLARLVTHRIALGALPAVLEELARAGTVQGRLPLRVVIDMDLPGRVVEPVGLGASS